jgi:choline dehydrogenase
MATFAISCLMSNRKSFRFVIIGAGSAGCHLAQLLAAGQSEPLAIIEAGSQASANDVRSVVPSYYPHTFGSQLDWNLATVPQAALGGRRLAWPRGKVLGGSGAINALIWMQPAEADLRNWPCWDAASSFPAHVTSPHQARATAEASWPAISPLATPHPWTLAFLQAATAHGLTLCEPWLQAQNDTCGLYQLTQRQGRRCHGGLILQQAAGNPKLSNLSVFTQAHVLRLILSNGKAIGVELGHAHGQRESIYASEQVILCAGAIGSPTLLMQSGIGDPQELFSLGIPCQHNLPWVGKNLQDHLVCPLVFSTQEARGLARRHTPEMRTEYRQWGTGELASNIAEAGALFSTESVRPSVAPATEPGLLPAPDFQLHFTATHYLKYPLQETANSFCSLGVTDLHPRSRGQIKLAWHSGGWQPLIDPAYLSDPADSQRLLSALRWTRELAAGSGLREIIQHEVMPGIKRTDDQSLLKWMRTFVQSIYHPVGTCRMACGDNVGAEWSVVGRDFRVHGLDGLRVVDASILPWLPSCNTNAATLGLAARGAREILGV